MSDLRLMLVRHGQTPANVARELDSAPPGPPLTELGQQQARDLAEVLATEPVTAVYASVAIRAQQTAAPTAARHGLAVQVIDGVHEVQVGELEGRSDPEAYQQFGAVLRKWTKGDLSGRPPGGESGAEVAARFLGAVSQVTAAHQDGVVVLVSHAAAIRLAADQLVSGLSEHFLEDAYLPNTGHITLAVDQSNPSGWRFVDWTGLHPH